MHSLHTVKVALIVCFLATKSSMAADESLDSDTVSSSSSSSSSFQLEGKVAPPDPKPKDWYWTTQILVDGGQRLAYIKDDNSFVISGLSSGSYLVEVFNSDYHFDPVRVDINSKGKIRARKVNNVQPSQINQVPYPLKMKSLGRYKYFQKREEWKVTDLLMNPMILMMILPLLLITVLPKMMNDPDTQKEMEQMQQNMSMQNQMPELSELMTNFFGGGGQAEKQKKKPKPIRQR